MAAYALLLAGYTEGFDAAMTGSAGFCLLHFLHGKMLSVFQIEDGIVTDPAVVVVLAQVIFVVKNNRLGAPEFKDYIFGRSSC